MMSLLNKYRKIIAYSVLFAYLFLISLTIFHYHHVDIQTGNYKLSNNVNRTNSNPLDSRDDLTHECMVQQFASTVIDYNFTHVFNFIQQNAEQNFSFLSIINSQPKPLYNSNQHRAPPNFL